MPIANDWRTITVEAPDGLKRETWIFTVDSCEPVIRLQRYSDERRGSKRNKWKPGPTGWPWSVPASVRDEVLRRFRDAVTVVEPSQ